MIRLTNLGIRLVDKDVLEAADAFGSSSWQKLRNVQLPLALPTIMAGINQTIMMALAMVVIASMIGVQGLGQPVLKAIANQYFTLGVFNGLAIVGIAIIFDRVSQAYGHAAPEAPGDRPWLVTSIEIRNLYKIFGPRGRRLSSRRSTKGMSKTELNKEHGHVLGLKDINISIPGGSIPSSWGFPAPASRR